MEAIGSRSEQEFQEVSRNSRKFFEVWSQNVYVYTNCACYTLPLLATNAS